MLQPKTHHIEDIDAGSSELTILPTPNARDYKAGQSQEKYKARKELWKNRGINLQLSLPQALINGMLPTPTCQDSKQKDKQSKPTTQNKRIEYSSSRWEQFPTQSPICGGDDGLPTELDGITFSKWRAESIKGYGNAIVPQVAYELFKIISKLL
jgi:hypothetical protein